MTITPSIETFREAMRRVGLEPEGELIADGILHRAHDLQDKPGKKDLWYIFFPDGIPAGSFGHWARLPDGQSWQAKPDNFITTEEHKLIKKRREQAQAARELALVEVRTLCREKAAQMLEAATDANIDYPYLLRKSVNPYGIKQLGDLLLIPVRKAKALTGLQIITPEGSKKFLTGTEKAGAYFVIKGVGAIIYLCEGYATGATIHKETGATVLVCFDCGNLLAVANEARQKAPHGNIIIVADNDRLTTGNPGLTKAKAAALAINAKLAIPCFPGDEGTDFNDLVAISGAEAANSCLDAASLIDPLPPVSLTEDDLPQSINDCLQGSYEPVNNTPRLRAVTIDELLLNEFPKRESLLHPILHTQSLNMVHAWRGCGKTHFGLGVAYATSSGGRFLKWKAETARGVLYIDGEMPGNSLQERLALIVSANKEEPPPGYFRVLTPDLQEPGTMPDLSTTEGQAAIDALVTDDTALIVVDNLSCLVRGGKENESESWIPIQGWALRHRAAGRSILFVHHSGKGGEQRGTSKREDVLDLVLKLKRPADYDPSQGACFEVIFEKARHLSGSDTSSFEATLTADETGKQLWVFRDVTESTYERVIELINIGLNQNEVAHELEINKSTVSRNVKKAKAEGKIQSAGK